MVRWSVLAGCATVVAGAAFVTGATVPTGPTSAKPEHTKSIVVIGQKNGYFNIAKVLREYKKAQIRAEQLNRQRAKLSEELNEMRSAHLQFRNDIQKSKDAAEKQQLAQKALDLSRQIEDTEREINKNLAARTATICTELHDELRAVVTDVAHENGLVAVHAYPDAVTREEMNNPLIKELRLKPPALQPFYLDSSVDYSDEIIRRLNEKFGVGNVE